ncbi:MAG: PD-(D/E)XK nuclease family protein [Treponema sp.]|nr:PD-(D/E)XK nuclease family protein [Treponema sp.]
MVITNKMNLPEALVKAVSIRRHNDPGRLSATTLLNGTKQILLTDRHWDNLEDDVANRFWAIIGTVAHKALEHEGEHEFAEEFVSYEIDGITVTGRIDLYNMKDEIITDYKTNSVYKIKFRDFGDWELQGMMYAWLLIKNGFKVKTCRFVSLIKDHSKRDAKRDPFYPQQPMYVYEFDVTQERLERIEKFIKDKIADYKANREKSDDEITPCTPKERWDKPTKYAVKKEGRKSALTGGVKDSLEDAEQMVKDLGKGHYIETRPGESVRCQDYCSCCEFCNYYRENVATAEDEAAA